jgi:hypothetical protein
VPFRRTREQGFPRTGEVYSDDEIDPRRFFGEADRPRRSWKALQLCKQVERAAALTLAGVGESNSLLGASVASVEPAPDPGRLMVTVILAAGKGVEDIAEASAALRQSTAAFREDVARWIHRKRVPEIVFDVRLAEEVARDRDA